MTTPDGRPRPDAPAWSAGSSDGQAGVRNLDQKRHLVQLAALAVGATFVLVGILGFMPGIVTHYSEMKFAGPHSDAMLVGLFCVSVLHNIVHLIFGVLGVLASRATSSAEAFLIGGGGVYLILAFYGSLVDYGSKTNFVPVNTADNWLHLVLGVGMIALGGLLGQRLLAKPGVRRQ